MSQKPFKRREDSQPAADASTDSLFTEYEVDAMNVAEALLARISRMADERAKRRRALIYSVEMIEAPNFDGCATRIH